MSSGPGWRYILTAGVVGTAALFVFSSTPRVKEKRAAMASSTPAAAARPEDVPGEKKQLSTSALEVGAGTMQRMEPIRQIGQHLCGMHFYNHDMTRQVEAHHFCSHLNEDVRQCVIYDSEKANARLIGVEFIVSEKLFKTFPPEERQLWHSHEYEVKSGLLFCPHLPAAAEHPVMEKLVNTFGKTWHFWQFDRGDPLPFGVPQLMAAFTEDGQADPLVVKGIEEGFNISMRDKKESRKDIKHSGYTDEYADYWQKKDKGLVLEMHETELKKVPMAASPSAAPIP